jgi:hypothetical protein
MVYEYVDSNGLPVISDVPLTGTVLSGLKLAAEVRKKDNALGEAARALADLPLLIAKQQKSAITHDPWQMWRYYNNAQVAREVLANTADAETVAAFEEMLAENKLSDPDYYDAMTTQTFAEWLIGLNREFKLLGLRLEAERIRQRRLLQTNS